MATEYNRVVCNFCLFAATCARLRTPPACDRCPLSLTCAQGDTFGTPGCEERLKEWRKEQLPDKCFLVEQLLVYVETRALTEIFVPVTDYPSFVVCPRCSQPNAHTHSDHSWTPMIVTPERGLAKRAMLKCDFCGLDAEHRYR